MCLWLLGSIKIKLQLVCSTGSINNEGPVLSSAAADGASRLAPTTEEALCCSMSSLLHRGAVRTAAVEQVVAPLATHLCHLVLLCDSEGEPEQFSRLEEAAQGVAKATVEMAAAARRYGERVELWLWLISTHLRLCFQVRRWDGG